MATFTTNYNLRKPATSDFITVSTDVNDNMDDIDTQMKVNADAIAVINAIENDRFVYRKNAAQTIAHATDTDVTWQTEVSDPNGLITSPLTTFTVPAGKAGVWAVSVSAQWATAVAAADVRAIRIEVNGNNVGYDSAPQHSGVNNAYNQCQCSWIGYLAVGDTVKITAFQDTGGNLTIDNVTGATQHTELTVQRIQ